MEKEFAPVLDKLKSHVKN